MAKRYGIMGCMTDDLPPDLKTLAAAYRRSHERYRRDQRALVEKIPDWIDSGVRQADIVRETGLTREYIRQIVEKAKKNATDA